MNELLKAKQDAYDKETFHRAQMARHEQFARKYQLARLKLNDKIREIERDLSEPIKVIYGKETSDIR